MNMLRAGIIAQRVDITQQLFPGVAAAALFVGTVAAAGGKLLVDTIDHLTGDLEGVDLSHHGSSCEPFLISRVCHFSVPT